MNKKRLKYILMGGVLILSLTGCDDYLNCEDTSGIITSDLIWQNPKAITAVLADMYDSGLRTDEFDDWYGAKHNLTNQTTLSDEATASYQKESAFDKADATYSYGTYIFNDDMATRYKQIRIVNNFLQHITVTSVLSDDEFTFCRSPFHTCDAIFRFGKAVWRCTFANGTDGVFIGSHVSLSGT